MHRGCEQDAELCSGLTQVRLPIGVQLFLTVIEQYGSTFPSWVPDHVRMCAIVLSIPKVIRGPRCEEETELYSCPTQMRQPIGVHLLLPIIEQYASTFPR